MSKRNYYIIAALLLTVYFINGIIAIPRLSLTFDEQDHYSYAIRVAQMHPEKIYPYDDASTMPVSALNALPRAIEQLFDPTLKRTDGGQHDVFAGRYISLIICSLIGLFILHCSTQLYGKPAGLFSLFLFAFCPNLNGHAILVATDAFSALFTLTSAWYFRQMLLDTRWRNVLLFAVHLGLAQLVKQSLSHLFIIYSILFIVYAFKSTFKESWARVLLKVVGAIAMVLLVINIGFLFLKTGQSLNQYHFTSAFFQSLQHELSWMGSIPLPVPEPYLSGLDLTKHIDEIGPGRPESSDSAYILGQTKAGAGFWYYYIVALFFKTPIPVLIISILALFRGQRLKDRVSSSFIFLFVIGWFFIYFSFFYRSQVGIRHILMVFPLLYVLLGSIADWLFRRRVVVIILAAYSVITYYIYYPNLIAYTNEFIIPKKEAYKKLADSNLDYGQSHFLLLDYIKKHPDVRIADSIPGVGKQVLSVNRYLDLDNSHRYQWLRPFRPIGQVAYSYLLFDISEADLTGVKSEQ